MQMKVLVIDDDREMAELLKMTLEHDTYEVITTNSGAQGAEMVRRTMPDVIIIDLTMPDIDSLQVCREVRKFSSVPILVSSAINKPEMIAQALDAGADDYLIKPIKISMLIAHLKKFARRAKVLGYKIQSNGSGLGQSSP